MSQQSAKKPRKAKRFSYHAKSIFLTYSQCPIDKETMLQHLKDKAKPKEHNRLLKAAIGQEFHEDGGKHLHVCAWYTHPLKFERADYMDIKDEHDNNYHPNVKDRQVNNRKKALTYCSKHDPEPLEFNIDIKAETKAREDHSKILTKELIIGKRTLQEMVDDGDIPIN